MPENFSLVSVELPPMKTETDAGKVFVFDHNDDPEKGEKEQETKLNIEVRLRLVSVPKIEYFHCKQKPRRQNC